MRHKACALRPPHTRGRIRHLCVRVRALADSREDEGEAAGLPTGDCSQSSCTRTGRLTCALALTNMEDAAPQFCTHENVDRDMQHGTWNVDAICVCVCYSRVTYLIRYVNDQFTYLLNLLSHTFLISAGTSTTSGHQSTGVPADLRARRRGWRSGRWRWRWRLRWRWGRRWWRWRRGGGRGGDLDVEPIGGRVVIFDSLLPHEVITILGLLHEVITILGCCRMR